MKEESFSDIETIPVIDGPMLDLFMKNLQPPKTIKKQESIDAWLKDESKIEEARLKTSFNPVYGSICSISVANDDDEPEAFYVEDSSLASEKRILEQFLKKIRSDGNQRTLIGHYFLGFDVPFISKRMLIHGLGPLFPFGTKPWDMNVRCTYEMFASGSRESAKLSVLCGAMGVKSPKEGMDGSMVNQAFLDGKFEEIADYNNDDVIAVRSVFRKMTSRV